MKFLYDINIPGGIIKQLTWPDVVDFCVLDDRISFSI